MGTIDRGYLSQDFRIRLDVQNLAYMIAEQLKKTIAEDKELSDVDIDESYFEADELVITGSYQTRYEHSHWDRTLETPEEDVVNRGYIGDHPSLIADLPKEIKENLSIIEVNEDDDMVTDSWSDSRD